MPFRLCVAVIVLMCAGVLSHAFRGNGGHVIENLGIVNLKIPVKL